MLTIKKGFVQAEGDNIELIADFVVLRKAISENPKMKEFWDKAVESEDMLKEVKASEVKKDEDVCDCPNCRLRREIRKEVEEENKLNKKEGL